MHKQICDCDIQPCSLHRAGTKQKGQPRSSARWICDCDRPFSGYHEYQQHLKEHEKESDPCFTSKRS